ncbi:MarR family winged helix-turn-helix transcriptional regulator [Stackebrandtia nassauensis]|uniref:Transcriptional regulator, MarR family n=1 Tax=Stackebrandtia nassauensis (strain DSM 44728 / CIP 108903 / NRRL B-16338 / NBRC 102104 / LLR-40K-21) TaxID=446470 RepID=D3PYM0_STANL|nr:MarR family winged helix-turn-helix transcriptional regulator [Stackebrandtia nassauensis]ADD43453.1 transcriptional regulator, MarR family [Stackebrandtia nassauensis DSM 44728]
MTTRPRWLSDSEMRAWLGYRRMRNLLDPRIDRDLQTMSELSEQDYDVLSHLSSIDGHRARLTELSARLRWSRSRLSHHLGRMEKRDLVTREVDPADGRGAVVALTDTGRTAIETAAPGHVASVRRHFIDLLSPEQIEVLGDIAETVLSRLRTEDPPPGG